MPGLLRQGPSSSVFGLGLFLIFVDSLLGTASSRWAERPLPILKLATVALATVVELFLIPYFQRRSGNGGLGVVIAFVACEPMIFAGMLVLIPRGVLGQSFPLDGARAIASAVLTGALLGLVPTLTPGWPFPRASPSTPPRPWRWAAHGPGTSGGWGTSSPTSWEPRRSAQVKGSTRRDLNARSVQSSAEAVSVLESQCAGSFATADKRSNDSLGMPGKLTRDAQSDRWSFSIDSSQKSSPRDEKPPARPEIWRRWKGRSDTTR